MKFYESKHFIKLQAEWSRKLKDSGFKDIEPREGMSLPGQMRARMLGRLEYYTQASKFLWDFSFNTERERTIWLYYSEGKTYREIAKLMGDKSHMQVHKFINQVKPIFLTYVKAQWDFDSSDDE